MLVTILYENDAQYDLFKVLESSTDVPFKFLYTSEKEAFRLKRHWAAKKCPFAVVTDEDRLVKIFYSEATDVLTELEKYLNENFPKTTEPDEGSDTADNGISESANDTGL